jgi:hypothetical protein
LTEGIDEFLAHITVVEAAFGLSKDHDTRNRPKLAGGGNQGATARVAARLSALIGAGTAGANFRRLFDTRSAFLHGRVMAPIPSQDRMLARRLAREAVVALMKAALAAPNTLSRETFLDALLIGGPPSI